MTDFTRYMDKYYELEVKYSGDILVSEPIYIEHGKTPKTKDNSFGFTEVYSSYELAVKAAIKYAHELQFYGQEALWTNVINGMIKRGKTEEQKIEELKQKQKVEEESEETAETVESVEETTVSETETVEETAEQETELNAEVAQVEAEQTAEPETFSKSKSESESEPTAENITVSGTNQDNINVLIVADVINTFEMITHTGYFDTS